MSCMAVSIHVRWGRPKGLGWPGLECAKSSCLTMTNHHHHHHHHQKAFPSAGSTAERCSCNNNIYYYYYYNNKNGFPSSGPNIIIIIYMHIVQGTTNEQSVLARSLTTRLRGAGTQPHDATTRRLERVIERKRGATKA